jgi:hypothetical protein
MPDTQMNERNIVFFPMQSVQIGTDEFGDPIYDNAADAEILQNLRQMEIKDGVYPDGSAYLQVMSNGDMTVTVKAGYAHVRGVQVWVKEDIVLNVEDADPLVDRTDRVILRLSMVDRDITITVKTGDTSLTRVEGQTWELGLADISVAHNNTVITQEEITDLRLDTTACGIVSGLMQVDTQTIFNQYLAWWENQQDTTGYMTNGAEYSSLTTEDKTVLGAINELNDGKLGPGDVINNLTSTDADKPLSAAQGKALNDGKLDLSGGTLTGDLLTPFRFVSGSVVNRMGGVEIGDGTSNAQLFMGEPGRLLVAVAQLVRFVNRTNTAYVFLEASAYNIGSSIRYKVNINPFADEEARKLLNIETKTFAYKKSYSDDGGKVHMGVIAEDLIDLFPDAVTVDDEGLPSGVDYAKLVVPCIGMIQQQQKTIEDLTQRIKKLEGK